MGHDGWVRVAAADDLKPGHITQVFVDDEPVALAHVDGEFLATHDVCSHEYAEMHDGWLEGDEIECPLHGSRFSMRTGEVKNLPATQPIQVYEVKVDGGDVYLRALQRS